MTTIREELKTVQAAHEEAEQQLYAWLGPGRGYKRVGPRICDLVRQKHFIDHWSREEARLRAIRMQLDARYRRKVLIRENVSKAIGYGWGLMIVVGLFITSFKAMATFTLVVGLGILALWLIGRYRNR
jgi:hypothetical protein